MTLKQRISFIESLFKALQSTNSKNEKELMYKYTLSQVPLDYNVKRDVEFCFEILAGKHKLGYTFKDCTKTHADADIYEDYTLEEFVNEVLLSGGCTADDIYSTSALVPKEYCTFIDNLCNRKYRLGFSNKNNMITNLTPMLAKKYPDDLVTGEYIIQEKLDGNRCIAYYDDGWKFQSRSGKPLNVNFNMDWAPTDTIFDGEIMTLDHAGTRDFTKTSGVINSKYLDKSMLHYYIYDIIVDKPYEERESMLSMLKDSVSDDCTVLKSLGRMNLSSNPQANEVLDRLLDAIVDAGGEGLILRKVDGTYEHKRTHNLLKYKKTQTMDLRIIDWNEGNGKYEGLIGSFICQTDDRTIQVAVSGISDEMRASDPAEWMGRIIEVAYFDISKSDKNNYLSLRFPRFVKVRDDKDTTSKW